MDNIVFFTKTKKKLRKIIKTIHEITKKIGLKLVKNKTYIGELSKGFDFLGYRIFPQEIHIAKTSYQRMIEKLYRHYVQQASSDRLRQYLKRWLQWTKASVGSVFESIQIYTKPHPSRKIQIKQSIGGLIVSV